MNIHEYQAKELLAKFGVNVPRGIMCESAEAASAAYEELGSELAVVKAQVHAGGRGKAGGVKLVKSAADAKAEAERMLGTRLVTHQTDAKGQPVNCVYVTDGIDIDKEIYLAILLDRAQSKPIIMASAEGGVEIEEIAEKTPEKIIRETIDPAIGLLPYQCRKVAYALGFDHDQVKQATKMMMGLYAAYTKTDADTIEINPLVITKQGEVSALDTKMVFDGNAMFRQKGVAEYRDPSQEDPREAEAAEYELNYVALDGNIGCMVNGAGLAMATMDIIKHFGAEPANFLDVGGGATEERVTAAFKIILSDPAVKGILVNIFGGIMKCDVIANGVVAAAKEVQLNVPLVVRLEGTNVDLGKKIMAESGLPIISADTLSEAAQKVVAAVKEEMAA